MSDVRAGRKDNPTRSLNADLCKDLKRKQALLASACSQPQTQPNAPETLSMEAGIRPVYASPNARRYHKDRSCKELTRTNSRMSVADARKQGMLPCPTCRPAR